MKKSTHTSRIETVTALTLSEALGQAVQTFGSHDAVCVTGDAYCRLTDFTEWMSTPPAAQSMVRCYVTLSGQVIERATGRIASRNIIVGMIPHTLEWSSQAARLRSSQPKFLFAVDSHRFMRTLPTWGQMRRVRPVALHNEGLEFEAVREAIL